jgi:hypothetical protein
MELLPNLACKILIDTVFTSNIIIKNLRLKDLVSTL